MIYVNSYGCCYITAHYIGIRRSYWLFRWNVSRKRYFECADGFGMFVPYNRLFPHYDNILSKQLTRPSQEELREVSACARDTVSGKRKESPVNRPSIFQEGDRVLFYDKKGNKKEGTVTWMGNSTKITKLGYNIIGIYTVSTELEFIYTHMVIFLLLHI